MTKVLIEETNLRNIADAIRSKSASTDTYKPADMASAIEYIPSGGGIEEYISEDTVPLAVDSSTIVSGITRSLKKVIDAKAANYEIYTSNKRQICYAFYNMENIESINGKMISEWNTTKYTNLTRMCSYCYHLSEMPALRNWDVSNVTSMSYMFISASLYTDKPLNLEPISNWNTSKVTDFSYCFGSISKNENNLDSYTEDVTLNWCLDKALSLINMFASGTNTSSTSGHGFMKGTFSGLYTTTKIGGSAGVRFNNFFNNQKKLEKIDLRNLNAVVSNVTTMFNNCFNLNLIDIRGFEMIKPSSSSTVSGCFNGVPSTASVIVKDQTEKTWWMSKFSSPTFYTVEEALAAGIIED